VQGVQGLLRLSKLCACLQLRVLRGAIAASGHLGPRLRLASKIPKGSLLLASRTVAGCNRVPPAPRT
jgi:hypothetical protein